MQNITIKKLIEFTRKSDKSKKTIAASLKLDKIKTDSESGGDYWISCLSAISNSFKSNDLKPIIIKIRELEEKYEETDYKQTKTMYQRNVEILYKYEDFDLNTWRPNAKLNFIKKNKDNSVLLIKDIPVIASPNHVFTFKKDGIEKIGAIWFIAQLNGFSKHELAMFTEILYNYLKVNFSKNYNINTESCIAVDIFNNTLVNFSQIEKGEVRAILKPTIDQLKNLL